MALRTRDSSSTINAFIRFTFHIYSQYNSKAMRLVVFDAELGFSAIIQSQPCHDVDKSDPAAVFRVHFGKNLKLFQIHLFHPKQMLLQSLKGLILHSVSVVLNRDLHDGGRQALTFSAM